VKGIAPACCFEGGLDVFLFKAAIGASKLAGCLSFPIASGDVNIQIDILDNFVATFLNQRCRKTC
jgi:hypothetical protein